MSPESPCPKELYIPMSEAISKVKITATQMVCPTIILAGAIKIDR